MRSKILLVALTATSMLAVPVAAFAQAQTDSTGTATGSRHVTNANRHVIHSTQHKMHSCSGTVGANMGTRRAKHPTPASTQGDVGPGGTNNGTLTTPTR
jgi:hypothetical protein